MDDFGAAGRFGEILVGGGRGGDPMDTHGLGGLNGKMSDPAGAGMDQRGLARFEATGFKGLPGGQRRQGNAGGLIVIDICRFGR